MEIEKLFEKLMIKSSNVELAIKILSQKHEHINALSEMHQDVGEIKRMEVNF
jgi:hypothetical protein